MVNTKLIAAWPGTGKTYICQKTDLKAIEIEYWQYKQKGFNIKTRELAINEYINDVSDQIGKVDYIFLATDPEGLKLLQQFNIILVYPQQELRSQYLDRYIDRNSATDFIGAFLSVGLGFGVSH